MATNQSSQEQACRDHEIELSRDAVLCCPQPDQRVWDAHPRVYLTFDADRKASCPYCGTSYRLSAS